MVKARWWGDTNNPNRDLSDPDWISVEGARYERKIQKERRDRQ